MLFVNYDISATRDELMSVMRDTALVVSEEKYDTSSGKVRIHIKEKNELLTLRCEMAERSTKDNAFLEGTYFRGRVTEKDGRTSVKGIILTAPIYHLVLLFLTVFFVIQCFIVGGISLVPIIMLIFSVFMFREEYKKQSLIKRYIFRALKITYARKNPDRASARRVDRS
ncbi:MAG: hypothetical protein J6Q85_04035 [Clostridia bacterium]|nr:hypothetical protein [Clostridia bacterium]